MNTIGVIAPNPQLYEIALWTSAALGMEDKVVARIANMEAGITVAREFENIGVEVIVTRGGTADMIKSSDVRISLVEIPINGQEIFHAVQTAKRLIGKKNPRLGIQAYNTMHYGIELFTQLSGLDMRIYEFGANDDTLETIVKRAVAEGIEVLIGGQMSVEIANRLGIRGVVLETTERSMRTALLEAEKVAALRRLEETRLQRTRIVLDLFPEGVIALDNDGRIQLINPSAFRLLGIAPDSFGERIETIFPSLNFSDVLEKGEAALSIIYPYKNSSFVVDIRPIKVRGDITGAVVIIQDTGNIRDLEAKIRGKHNSTGLTATHRFQDIMAESPVMRETVRKAKQYAATRGTIIINGETGTGKEVFAQSIHNASPCRQGPFVAVNCAALPPSLLESELFGYEEGAFTGAMRNGKPGYFELAHGGTIFLDEISEIDRYGQTRLLRVLQERRSMRLGGGRSIQLDVRVIASSNRNLKELVAAGDFREDLYYRLSALTLHLPPLRKRSGDIRLLARHFASVNLGRFEKERYFTEHALEHLEAQLWPGNVRELQNVIERLCLFYENKPFDTKAVRESLHADQWGDKEEERIESGNKDGDSERERIVAALRAARGNQGQAARTLGINPSTLYRKMRRYGILKFRDL